MDFWRKWIAELHILEVEATAGIFCFLIDVVVGLSDQGLEVPQPEVVVCSTVCFGKAWKTC